MKRTWFSFLVSFQQPQDFLLKKFGDMIAGWRISQLEDALIDQNVPREFESRRPRREGTPLREFGTKSS